ncbi:eukaryotic translation initiation factor 4 gamma 2-like [Clavelina lepadiformis]|uniref:eukaryotic translation initiation factor 4 gamma 2-like n=1 Tax=Clavelina lepadiformis TaxID=159417 RepID=UPI004042DF82
MRDVNFNKNEIIFRKTRSILNKLTPEKFDKLCQDILNIGIESKVILKGIVILIFEKAIDELRYSSLYANLCRRLYHEAPNFDASQTLESCIPKPNTFRRLLIAKLQDEFENRNRKLEAFDSKDDLLSLEEVEQRARAKQHVLGNIKFIGELYRLNLLHESIVHKCIKQLINKKKKGLADDLSEDLECLCQIMTTCGRRLDHARAKSLMDQYFDRLDYLQRKKTDLPARIRFMLQDVIDLRAANWVPRNTMVNQNPKTLGQIRSEVGEKHPGLLFDAKPASAVQNQESSESSAGLGFFPKTKKQQIGGFSGPLSPQAAAPIACEPTSPGVGFDFFTPLPTPSAPHRPNTGLAHSMFTPRYLNGVNSAPIATQQPPQARNGYSHSNSMRYSYSSRPDQRGSPKAGVRQVTRPEPRTIRPMVSASVMTSQKQTLHMRNPVHSKVSRYNTALNGTSSEKEHRNITHQRGISSASADAFQPSFQHVLDKQKPTDQKTVVSSSEETKRIKPATTSQKEAENLCRKVVANFFSNDSFPEEKMAFITMELNLPKKFMTILCQALVERSLHFSEQARCDLCRLLRLLSDRGMITPDHISQGVQLTFEKLGDLESELPRIKSVMASLLARVVVHDLLTLKEVAMRLEGGYLFPLFLLMLQQMMRIKNKDFLLSLFTESNIKMMTMMPEVSQDKKETLEILNGKQLSFLLPLLRMEMELSSQLNEEQSPTGIYRWIRDNISSELQSDPRFIEALMTCCLDHMTRDCSLADGVDRTKNASKEIQMREKMRLSAMKPVLQKFMHDQTRLQLHALYAVQTFAFTNNFPKGLMLRLFDLLYNEDIIDEEIFLLWKEDVNDEVPGKGKSLFQVNAWLTWLQEADTEDDEEEV